MDRISPQRFLSALQQGEAVAVDVRSPGECSQASIPGAFNLPLLNNDHRHQVGLTYKTSGQKAAIAKGHELVDPLKEDLLRRWTATVKTELAHVFCWRGGLRSQISVEWMREAGLHGVRVEGGYRSIRQQLLRVLEFPPALFVIAGETGSGKTEFLREFEDRLDLEELAHHRGSVFGGFYGMEQPSQTSFENAIAVRLWGRAAPSLVEDESRFIGRCRLPHWFHRAKHQSPTIWIEEPLEERVARIYRDYVAQPTLETPALREKLNQELERLGKALGGARLATLRGQLKDAFEAATESAHRVWIRGLLVEYYDPRYQWAMEKRKETLRFRGDRQACRRYLQRKGFH